MEIWKDVLNYEGIYAVSNLGNVSRISWGYRKPIKQHDHRRINAYKVVRLSKGGICKMKLVHRLVAEVFIPNPKNKPEVNHIDRNKLNNISDNLEWVTHNENIRHSTGVRNKMKSFYELFPHLKK